MNLLEKVLYMSYVSHGKEGLRGFVFPRDLEDNEYNPGIFIIVGDSHYNLKTSYTFIAIDGEERVSTELKRLSSTTYGVSTRHGLFLFRIKLLKPTFTNFLGSYQHFPVGKAYYQVNPMQTERLESVCRSHNFFFVGSTDEEDDEQTGI